MRDAIESSSGWRKSKTTSDKHKVTAMLVEYAKILEHYPDAYYMQPEAGSYEEADGYLPGMYAESAKPTRFFVGEDVKMQLGEVYDEQKFGALSTLEPFPLRELLRRVREKEPELYAKLIAHGIELAKERAALPRAFSVSMSIESMRVMPKEAADELRDTLPKYERTAAEPASAHEGEPKP